MRVRDEVFKSTNGDVVNNKCLFFGKGEIIFRIEAYETYLDDPETDLPNYEGEDFFEEYTDFFKAIEKVVELKKRGWEDIRFSIRIPENEYIHILFFAETPTPVGMSVWVNQLKIAKKMAEKLARIEEIIREG